MPPLGQITPPPELARHVTLADLDEVTYENEVGELVEAMREQRRAHRLDRPFGTELAVRLGGTYDPPAPLVTPATRAGP